VMVHSDSIFAYQQNLWNKTTTALLCENLYCFLCKSLFW
jgi:hypothetical protein